MHDSTYANANRKVSHIQTCLMRVALALNPKVLLLAGTYMGSC
jgi:hypothetical protein